VGSVPGGAASGANFGVKRLCERPGPNWGYVSRGKAPVAGERGTEVIRGLVERRRAWRRRAGRRRTGRRGDGRGRGVGQKSPPWPLAGDGAPRCEVYGDVVAFQRFIENFVENYLCTPNRPWAVGAPPDL
jgi:hypothetical protein